MQKLPENLKFLMILQYYISFFLPNSKSTVYNNTYCSKMLIYSTFKCPQFVYNLMACGKKSNNAPTEEFILESPAPVDVAAKISAIYRELSVKVITS